jgi:hypothetical protein
MNSENILSVSWSPVIDGDRSKKLVDALDGMGGYVIASDRLERRGLPAEVWQFLLQTDWAVVRDTVVATALASGAPAGVKALHRGARALASRFKKVAETMPADNEGAIIIRDTRTGVEFTIPSGSIQDEQLWLALVGGDLPFKSNSTWNPESREWQELK